MVSPNSKFERELGKLEKLLTKLNKQEGGDNEYEDQEGFYARGGASNRGPARTFKLIAVNGKSSSSEHHAVLYEKTKDGKPKKVSVTSVARKIFRQLCRSMGQKNDCKLTFTIVETTRELDADGHLKRHNERTYDGKVEKKKTPTSRKLPGGKTIVNRFDYKVKHVPVGM